MFHCIGDGGFGNDVQCIFGWFGTVWFVCCRDRDALKSITGLFLGSGQIDAIFLGKIC